MESTNPIFSYIDGLASYQEAEILMWLYCSVKSIQGDKLAIEYLYFRLIKNYGNDCQFDAVETTAINGIEVPLCGISCMLTALVPQLLQPPANLLIDYEIYLRKVVEILRCWISTLCPNPKRPRVISGMLGLPTPSSPPYLILGTTKPKRMKSNVNTSLKRKREKLAKGLGFWSESLEKWDVGDCAETIPIATMSRAGPRQVVLTLSVDVKSGEYKGPCKTCQVTLQNYANDYQVMVLDLESGLEFHPGELTLKLYADGLESCDDKIPPETGNIGLGP
ncbi:hypothetical protein TWF694_011631 [Orbilia ellipsospora]|uniref:Uncharacterized protein n=1 Tax=Orbilia ellipsospora TaxID=2528407 RepID=A0AAV9X5U5_9PEZI